MLPADPVVEARDASGRPAAGVAVQFLPAPGSGWTSDTTVITGADGRASVSWYAGSHGGVTNTLRVSVPATGVELTAMVETPHAGAIYYGRMQYMEYDAGDLPVVITAPHGGSLTPVELPDRTGSAITTATDTQTEALAHAISDAFMASTGHRPHLVICRLRRTKIDANREIVEAAQGNRLTERAWAEFHSFAEAARQAVLDASGTGFYIDLHGHGHEMQRLELGYLLTSTDLSQSDAALDATSAYRDKSSIRTLATEASVPFSVILRGSGSLGALFESNGFPAVPSVSQPSPGNDPYFDGGYNTARYGSRDGGGMSGVQIETNYTGVRDSPFDRAKFGQALVNVLSAYLGVEQRGSGGS
jgi:hypothetical protein